jgi:hypothetical protein
MEIVDEGTNTGQIMSIESSGACIAHVGVTLSLGMRENRHSLAPFCSRQPFRSIEPSWAKTVTAVLSNTVVAELADPQ